MLCRRIIVEQCKKSKWAISPAFSWWTLGIPLLASYTNVNQLSLKDAKCRKHAHCFSIKWKTENDRVLNYYLPILVLLFSSTYTNDNVAAHQIVISKTFVMSPHMTILGPPHKIFVLRNNTKQYLKIVTISFPFMRISVSASFPGKNCINGGDSVFQLKTKNFP